ncbi:hypothetical protein TNIN_395701 [Trichonephila inaurata madagascariensis]|uniref:Uncharacterized protein n=1 Tax=Trichonephila inaurata madagascariensis TaxID=2747483 RepID=A0A8X6X040_9ARAC|nr:hypothetical protein TNIN_395701 [Trichonephila inaurata madagascariensis]
MWACLYTSRPDIEMRSVGLCFISLSIVHCSPLTSKIPFSFLHSPPNRKMSSNSSGEDSPLARKRLLPSHSLEEASLLCEELSAFDEGCFST